MNPAPREGLMVEYLRRIVIHGDECGKTRNAMKAGAG